MRSTTTPFGPLGLLFLLLMAGCGAGGGAGDGVGVFIDALVSGLQYETPTHEGVTDRDGRFRFEPGEEITFRLGGTVLGTADAKSVMTPLDLVPGAEAPTTNPEFFAALAGRSPASRVLNMLVFLQTLDADEDLDNGIQIPQRVPELLAGIVISFDQSTRRFAADVTLRGLIRDGLQSGLWGGIGRPIRDAAKALDHFYAHAGIQSRFLRIVAFERDTNNDGFPESRFSYAYGPNDERAELRPDADGDGDPEVIFVRHFNTRGDTTLRTRDDGLDGSIEEATRVEYDDGGHHIADVDFEDGQIRTVTHFHHDELAYLRLTETDFGANGSINRRVTLRRDVQGRVIREERDDNGDQNLDRVLITGFNAQGLVDLRERDDGADGNIDERERYTFDPQGRERLLERDEGADGSVEFRVTTSRDDNQRIHVSVVERDGLVNSITRRTFDAQGREVRFERDTNADGTMDERQFRTFEAFREIIEDDLDANDSIDRRTTVFLDEFGNRVRVEYDEGADGVIETVETIRYEPASAFTALLFD